MFTKLKNWWAKHKEESDEEFYAILREAVPPATFSFKYGADGPPPTMWEEGKTIIMPRWLKEEWVAALRSGDYLQGTGYLYSDDEDAAATSCAPGYCCLGVLCDVAGENITPREALPSLDFLNRTGVRFRDAEGKEGTRNPLLSLSEGYSAGVANDARGKTFNEIADMIESVVQTY